MTLLAPVTPSIIERDPTPSPSLLRSLNALKGMRSARQPGSVAGRLFAKAWTAVNADQPARDVALAVTSAAVSAVELCDYDVEALAAFGLTDKEVRDVLFDALDAQADGIDPVLGAALFDAPPLNAKGIQPPFVSALSTQPRAGAATPGKPRLALYPSETHAEHCLLVGVYAVLMAPRFGADIGTVFLAALSHHLHNAEMPDAGYAGEVRLGPYLSRMIDEARARALAQLTPTVQAETRRALTVIDGNSNREALAFHAADVLDRVIEVEQRLAAGSLTLTTVLRDTALVHDGPMKEFQSNVLRDMGLAA